MNQEVTKSHQSKEIDKTMVQKEERHGQAQFTNTEHIKLNSIRTPIKIPG
jgi:hypothetical protein